MHDEGEVSRNLEVEPTSESASGKPRSDEAWCPWPESNQHSLRNSILSRARLPVPPQGHSRDPALFEPRQPAKRADYSRQQERVNPRGCDFAPPRQAGARGIRDVA